MNQFKRIVGLTVFVAVYLMAGGSALAQHTWSGAAGANDSWGTALNWTNNAVPSTSYNGRIVFTNADVGNINMLDARRLIYGTAQNVSYGLYYSSASSTGGHWTDLSGHTLIVNGGTLSVGLNVSNCVAVITNGTIELGGGFRTDLNVGVNTMDVILPGQSSLVIAGTLNVTNLGYLTVGRHQANAGYGNRGGTLNLAGATINSTNGPNTLTVIQDLRVAANSGAPLAPVSGNLLLPLSLQALDAGGIYLGYERQSAGCIDFGAGSSLTNIMCRGPFYMSYGGYGELVNMPMGVTFTVGLPGKAADMNVARSFTSSGTWLTGTVVVAEGRFAGNIANWYIGHQPNGNTPNVTGRVDISTCSIQLGASPNMIDVGRLSIGSRDIGSEGGGSAYGVLRISPAVTNLRTGIFQLGAGLYGNGTLDIGTNSQLKSITVTNGLYWGGNLSRFGYNTGSGFVNYFPAGIEFQVGLPNKFVPMELGVLYPHVSRGGTALGNITITNGTFRGYLSSLRIGINASAGSVQYPVGILDLRNATVGALTVTGDVHVGSWPATGNKNASGYLALPAATAGFSNNVYVGDVNLSARGVIELFRSTLNLSGKMQVFAGGAVTARVGTVSCGLEFLTGNTNNFLIGSTGRVCVVFEADPTNITANLAGLRMAGNRVAYFESLTNGNRLSWDTSALTPGISAGIYYDAALDKTYVGIPGNAVAPTIENRMATNVTLESACLNGYLASTGTHQTTVAVYWGDSDGGDVALGNWRNTNVFAAGQWEPGTYPTTNVTLYGTNKVYYYRYSASSLAGSSLNIASTNFLAGEITVQATEPNASMAGLVAGTFTVWRASAAMSEALTVYYTNSGTAAYGLTYTLNPAGSVTIPAGTNSATIAVNPIATLQPFGMQTVVLTLLPGGYVIGSPASDSVYLSSLPASTNTAATACGPWIGQGLLDLWSDAANWASNASPQTSYTGRILFTSNDLGGLNLVEADRVINGAAQSVSQGLHYNINAPDAGAGHTTDLGGYTLTLNGGSLQAGYNAGNSVVTIRNGTLVLGDGVRSGLYAGYYSTAAADVTGVVVTLTATVDVRNAGSVIVGRQEGGNSMSAQGELDLSGGRIVCGATNDILALQGDLAVGVNSYNWFGTGTKGIVRLPPTLQSLSVSNLIVGQQGKADGLLDFGAGSGLTNLSVRGSFSLATYSGHGCITNMPPDVALTVGEPASPQAMTLGLYSGDPTDDQPIEARLSITNGRFTGYLSSLIVGQHIGGNPGILNALFDLGNSVVQIGPAAGMIQIPSLFIGSKIVPPIACGYAQVRGVFRIPSVVTNISAGTLSIGNAAGAQGLLDIGDNSALRTLIVTNGLYLGGYGVIGYESGSRFVDCLPTGLSVRVGQPVAPCPLYLGVRPAGQWGAYGPGEGYTNGMGRLSLADGVFAGYLSGLYVGLKEDGANTMLGVLNLSNSTVSALQIDGNAWIGGNKWRNSDLVTESGNQNGKGYVYLPAAAVSISSNLVVGDTDPRSGGWLELFGTTVVVSNTVAIDSTGVVTTHVYSASCGLDMASGSTSDFTIASSGRVHVDFTTAAPKVWGLRMDGDQRVYFQELHDSGRLTWSAPSREVQIAYVNDKTVVRLPPAIGTILMIQ